MHVCVCVSQLDRNSFVVVVVVIVVGSGNQ